MQLHWPVGHPLHGSPIDRNGNARNDNELTADEYEQPVQPDARFVVTIDVATPAALSLTSLGARQASSL